MKENEINIEDIKKGVLNQIKAVQKYKRIPEEKIIKWINEVPSYEFNPRIITEDKGEVDKDILFNRKISDVIAFYLNIKIIILKKDGQVMKIIILCFQLKGQRLQMR